MHIRKKWIILSHGKDRLNSNEELLANCPHMRKYKLARINSEGIDILRHTIIPDTDHTSYDTNVPRTSLRIRRANVKWPENEWTK